jgi:hypothetical protein
LKIVRPPKLGEFKSSRHFFVYSFWVGEDRQKGMIWATDDWPMGTKLGDVRFEEDFAARQISGEEAQYWLYSCCVVQP